MATVFQFAMIKSILFLSNVCDLLVCFSGWDIATFATNRTVASFPAYIQGTQNDPINLPMRYNEV
jgi:hypothetical protein